MVAVALVALPSALPQVLPVARPLVAAAVAAMQDLASELMKTGRHQVASLAFPLESTASPSVAALGVLLHLPAFRRAAAISSVLLALVARPHRLLPVLGFLTHHLAVV